MVEALTGWALAVPVAAWLGSKARARLLLSRAKHPSLHGHARWAARLARQMPFYEFDEARFFTCDDPPDDVAAARRAAFASLGQRLRARAPRTTAATRAPCRPSPICSSSPATACPSSSAAWSASTRLRRVPPGRRRGHRHGPRWERQLRPGRVAWRQRLRLRHLPILCRRRHGPGTRTGTRARQLPPWSRTLPAASVRSPASTKCRSTCRAPKR